MLALARSGVDEGLWLRAERQSAGRGRQGRVWVSEPGNLYASTLVRLQVADPAAATLALMAAVAVAEEVGCALARSRANRGGDDIDPPALQIKWPNDILLGGAKLAGILLERTEDAVVIGIGVNLAHHPDGLERPVTALAAHGCVVDPGDFLNSLTRTFSGWLARWRSEGIAPIRARWLEAAHQPATALSARLPDGTIVTGAFETLGPDGALILRLADGTARAIHAGDVFLV